AFGDAESHVISGIAAKTLSRVPGAARDGVVISATLIADGVFATVFGGDRIALALLQLARKDDGKVGVFVLVLLNKTQGRAILVGHRIYPQRAEQFQRDH